MEFGPVEKAVKRLLVFFAQPHSKLPPPSMFCFLGEAEIFILTILVEFLRSKNGGDQNHLCNSAYNFGSFGNGTPSIILGPLNSAKSAKFCLDHHALSLGEWFKIAVMSLTVIIVVEVDRRVRKK